MNCHLSANEKDIIFECTLVDISDKDWNYIEVARLVPGYTVDIKTQRYVIRFRRTVD